MRSRGRAGILPEFTAQHSIKLSPKASVPVTDRILNLIDSKTFQRLRRVRQLSLADRVFPSATHTRFSHALGVYRNLLDYLRHLDRFPRFQDQYDREDYLALLLAGLCHDLGHYPCSHQLDHLPAFPAHETLTVALLEGKLQFDGENLADLIHNQFGLEPQQITQYLQPMPQAGKNALLKQLIDSPLDADKCDYLIRDSHNCGVDYGSGFDRERFIDNLMPSRDGQHLGIHEKGLVSAEKFQLARYWMYRSVYWGHTVRAFISMLGRVCEAMSEHAADPIWQQQLLGFDDFSFLNYIADQAQKDHVEIMQQLALGRRPFKRLFTLSYYHNPERYEQLLNPELRADLCEKIVRALKQSNRFVRPSDLIWDVPPPYKTNRWETFPVITGSGTEVPIERESPVIQALGNAFLHGVRKIRLFIHPDLFEPIQTLDINEWL